MKTILVPLLVCSLFWQIAIPALAAENSDPVEQLDVKITKSLQSSKWNTASTEYIQAIWSDFKLAHIANEQDLSRASGIAGKLPDVESYDQYIGKYRHPGFVERRGIIEVKKSDSGRFVVKLEGHVMPAVAANRCVYFTTGDVVYSRLPELGSKPYAELEFFMIVRLDGDYVLMSPGHNLDDRNKIEILNE